VQEEDIAKYLGSGVVQFLVPAFGGSYAVDGLPPSLPDVATISPYSKARDVLLAVTPRVDGYWANVLHMAMSKIISRGINFEGPVPLRLSRMNELFRLCDGRRGFASFLERHLTDYLTTSNGAWVEIERTSRSPMAKILSFHHLDSLRVWRTGDPDVPAIYWDLRGRYHELKWWECFNVTDMESSRAGWWYGGECAAERAYVDVRAMASMNKLFDEKITGAGFTKIVFIPGLGTVEQIENAKKVATNEQLSKGISLYQGALMVPFFGDANSFKDILEIQLKGLPEDWERDKELKIRLLNYANSVGMSPFEIHPELSARSSLSGDRQSQILDENEKGRGLGSWEKKFLNHINNLITPDATTALLVTVDLREQAQKAQNAKLRAETRAVMRGTAQIPGEITAQQSLLMAVENEDVPREFKDMTTPADESLSTEEKPQDESERAMDEGADESSAIDSAPDSAPEDITQKEANPVTAFIQAELARAKQLVRKVRGK
jgi:hypothetical protein